MTLRSSTDAARWNHDPVASSSHLRGRVAGAVVGALLAAAVVFLAPWLLDAMFSLTLPAAWGMGEFAFVLCAAGMVPGALFYRRLVFPA